MTRPTNIGPVLKLLRECKGVTAKKVAEDTGISGSIICRIEQGRNPSWDNACKLADYFGISLDSLRKVSG